MLFYLVVRFGGVALERCPQVIDQLINPNHHQRISGCNISTYWTVSHISHFSIWMIWSTVWGRIKQRCLLVSHKQKSNTLWKHQPLGKIYSATSFKQLNFKRFGCFRLLHFETAKIVYWKHHSHYSLGISNLPGSPCHDGPMASLHEWSEVTGGGFREMGVENGTLIIPRCAEWDWIIFSTWICHKFQPFM